MSFTWFSNPSFTVNHITDNILTTGFDNPIDLGPVQLSNVRGRVRVGVHISDSDYRFSFMVDGGSISRNLHYTTLFRLVKTGEECTVTVVKKNVFEVETPVEDEGGRLYRFTFSPNVTKGPTIELIGGTPLVDANVYVFQTKNQITGINF